METLCWLCNKACGTCGWSKNFTPIAGWKEIITGRLDYHGEVTEGHLIVDCPEFSLDPRCVADYEKRMILIKSEVSRC